MCDTEFAPDGYVVFRKDRNLKFYPEGTYVKEKRGGVLMLIKGNLNPCIYDKGECDAELLWVTVSVNKVSLLVGVA